MKIEKGLAEEYGGFRGKQQSEWLVSCFSSVE